MSDLEINKIKQAIKEIQEDLTNLKVQLCYNKLIRPEDFLTDDDRAEILNKRKYMCLICNEVKPPEDFIEFNEETGKGLCKQCIATNFPGNQEM